MVSWEAIALIKDDMCPYQQMNKENIIHTDTQQNTIQPLKGRKSYLLQKSEKERQILQELTYMWKLKKSKLKEIEIRLVVARGGDGGEETG